MPDGPRRSMLKDPDSQKRDITKPITCEKCGGTYYVGDWVWCQGRAEQHLR